MVEYTRDKILPENLIQKTNLQQHNFMIDAINDIDGRQGSIEDVTNVNIDDIAVLKTGVVTLSNEKLDKTDIDADLHFGDISVTRDGTAVIMSLDVLNPTTGIITPISFTIPGATSAEAGTMDASSVAWIADAEARISALEGLSDVKAVADLPGTPSQAQLTAGWVVVAEKQPETGDILQDINNAKLWVFVGTAWVLYGSIITVPLATTNTIGGVRDTSLTAPGNRWYVHVETDGRLSLIGGDSLSTLINTTIPALQTGLNGKFDKSGGLITGNMRIFTALKRDRLLFGTPLSDGDSTQISFIGDGAPEEQYMFVRIGGTINGVTSYTQPLTINRGYLSALTRPTPGNTDIAVWSQVNARILKTEKGQPSGVATLDAGGKVPTTQLPARAISDVSGLQTALDGTVKNTGNERINGVKTFVERLDTDGGRVRLHLPNGNYGEVIVSGSANDSMRSIMRLYRYIDGAENSTDVMQWYAVGAQKYATVPMHTSPGADHVVNVKYVIDQVAEMVNYVDGEVDTHEARKDNPHSVTKAQVGLGNVDNTSDSAKPISTATQTALNGKVNRGGTIDAGDDVSWRPAIANNTWIKCANPGVANFVTALLNHQNIKIDISLDANAWSTVCEKDDTAQGDGHTTHSFLVPKNWWYRVVFNPGETCNIVEQKLMLG